METRRLVGGEKVGWLALYWLSSMLGQISEESYSIILHGILHELSSFP